MSSHDDADRDGDETDRDVEARRVCSACGEPTGYVVVEDDSVGGTALSECCREALAVEVSSS